MNTTTNAASAPSSTLIGTDRMDQLFERDNWVVLETQTLGWGLAAREVPCKALLFNDRTNDWSLWEGDASCWERCRCADPENHYLDEINWSQARHLLQIHGIW